MNDNYINQKLIDAKSNYKTAIMPLVAFTVALLFSQTSYAKEHTEVSSSQMSDVKGAKYSRHNKMKHMIKKLQLDSEQQAQIRAIRKSAKVKNKSSIDSLKRYHKELNLLIKAEHFDVEAVTALHNANQANMTQIAVTKAKTRHKILQVLSEEQQVKWFSITERYQEKRMNLSK